MNIRTSVCLTAILLTGCTSHGERVAQQQLEISGPQSLRIGAACTRSQGWQAPELVTETEVRGRGPVAVNVSAVKHPISVAELGPGVGYCIPPGGVYPHGYYTMNCAKDSDCPAGSRCDDVQCRISCTDDHDCLQPSTCGAPIGGVRFCFCVSCAGQTH